MKNVNDLEYWENIYLNNDTGWDLGAATPYIEKISDEIKKGKVIILGCGRGYDAVMLAKKGFEVTAVDFSPSAINFLNDLANQKSALVKIIQRDIFSLADNFKGHFDYVIEQTCFCAINPVRRLDYEKLVSNILCKNGKLIGLWFPLDKKLSDGGPPYGTTVKEVKSIFNKGWKIKKEEFPKESIKTRIGREKLIIFEKV